MSYTKEDIANIIALKDSNGIEIDIWNLGGILYLDDGCPSHSNCKYSAHSLFINYEDFEYCETEEEVLNQWKESLKTIVLEKLL